MGDFNRDNRSGGGRNFGQGGFDRSRDTDRRPQMHKAICSSCKKECELPFKPTGDRPVYCRECFAKNGGGESRKDFGRDNRNSERPGFRKFEDNRPPRPPMPEREEKLDAINYKLDQILKLLSPVIKVPLSVKEEEKEVVAKVPQEKVDVVIKKKRLVKKVSKATIKTPTEENI